MIQGIDDACKRQKCTRQELIRIAISKILFEENISTAESYVAISQDSKHQLQSNIDNSEYDIPLDRIISVQYTLDDGKIIQIVREKKPSGQ